MTDDRQAKGESPCSALSKRWKVVEPGETEGHIEDMSIFTEDDEEVVGCSEWMRAEREVFDHIVTVHNASLPNGRHEPAT